MQLLQVLREATGPLHRRLDDAVSEQPIEISSGYTRFLSMHAQILPAIEGWLLRSRDFATLPDFRERLRADALRRDLSALNQPIPATQDMSFLNDETSVAGICYVLEGSRLGAAYLCSLLGKSDASLPTAFLRHGTGQRHWKTFLVWLTEQDCSASAADRAASSARQVFESYLKALLEQDNNRIRVFGTS
jgi:heme oxygenase